LAKRYVLEDGSVSVRRVLRAGPIATSRLSEVEIVSALARRQREGALTAAERDRAIKTLNADIAAWVLVELTQEVARDSQPLITRHALRAGDAIQLASCLWFQRETGLRVPFGVFDERLVLAARAEKLPLVF
jgi:predicted nucleic acid-binding protein